MLAGLHQRSVRVIKGAGTRIRLGLLLWTYAESGYLAITVRVISIVVCF